MGNRREFLQASAAASVATGIGLSAASAQAVAGSRQSTPTMPLYEVIYDRRFAEARDFAEENGRLGVYVQAIEHDVTRLWLQDLLPRWREERVAVAGLTAECSYFCLKELARDLGLRTVYHGEHLFQPDGLIRHTLTAPPEQLNRGGDLALAPWGAQVARLVGRCPAGASASQQGLRRVFVHEPERSASRELEQVLISWVLAPVARKTGPYA